MNQDPFESFIADALRDLPNDFSSKLDNVEITVEEWPDEKTLRTADIQNRRELLGYYHGVPHSKRTHNYTVVLPDRITLYRQPIELRCRTREDLRSTIYHVLYHEIAHHFGISDQRLRHIGAY